MSALFQETWPSISEAPANGAGVIVKVPLESGWLSGRYDAGSTFTDVRSRWSPDDVQPGFLKRQDASKAMRRKFPPQKPYGL